MKNKENIKENIIGNLDNNNYNYKGRESLKELPKLFPQENDVDMKVFGIKQNRIRYKEIPNRYPTNSEMPYPPDEHAMIGQYEPRHNTYLMMAHAYNKAMERIDNLEKRIQSLERTTK